MYSPFNFLKKISLKSEMNYFIWSGGVYYSIAGLVISFVSPDGGWTTVLNAISAMTLIFMLMWTGQVLTQSHDGDEDRRKLIALQYEFRNEMSVERMIVKTSFDQSKKHALRTEERLNLLTTALGFKMGEDFGEDQKTEHGVHRPIIQTIERIEKPKKLSTSQTKKRKG